MEDKVDQRLNGEGAFGTDASQARAPFPGSGQSSARGQRHLLPASIGLLAVVPAAARRLALSSSSGPVPGSLGPGSCTCDPSE